MCNRNPQLHQVLQSYIVLFEMFFSVIILHYRLIVINTALMISCRKNPTPDATEHDIVLVKKASPVNKVLK